ncbi:hypothetical protein BDP27DRAFT_1402283 [Rhodocollybia butyracea]|uniref:Uncharacterized protein n=1 Tax=Rhodocollybia butyracea TaxID=206335 RepID=A0A9P5PXT4_9AGAR|nr:hypothetical protein BDP27DRAFT_1402283 [Rhodocollybia butyracea]
MSSSNNDLLLANKTPTDVAVPSDDAGTEEAKAAVDVNGTVHFTSSGGEYRVKAAVDVDDKVHFTGGGEQHLTPEAGTKGFLHSTGTVKIDDTVWYTDLYAYRHFNSSEVTLILIHSGHCTGKGVFGIRTIPSSTRSNNYPATYDQDLGDSRYSYRINESRDINMLSRDGKNPIPVNLSYKEEFITGKMDASADSFCKYDSGSENFNAMTILSVFFEVGESFQIGFGFNQKFNYIPPFYV